MVFSRVLTPTRNPKCGDRAKGTVCRLTSLAKVWFLVDTWSSWGETKPTNMSITPLFQRQEDPANYHSAHWSEPGRSGSRYAGDRGTCEKHTGLWLRDAWRQNASCCGWYPLVWKRCALVGIVFSGIAASREFHPCWLTATFIPYNLALAYVLFFVHFFWEVYYFAPSSGLTHTTSVSSKIALALPFSEWPSRGQV